LVWLATTMMLSRFFSSSPLICRRSTWCAGGGTAGIEQRRGRKGRQGISRTGWVDGTAPAITAAVHPSSTVRYHPSSTAHLVHVLGQLLSLGAQPLELTLEGRLLQLRVGLVLHSSTQLGLPLGRLLPAGGGSGARGGCGREASNMGVSTREGWTQMDARAVQPPCACPCRCHCRCTSLAPACLHACHNRCGCTNRASACRPCPAPPELVNLLLQAVRHLVGGLVALGGRLELLAQLGSLLLVAPPAGRQAGRQAGRGRRVGM
jgi:hypothetical protein